MSSKNSKDATGPGFAPAGPWLVVSSRILGAGGLALVGGLVAGSQF